MLANVQIVRVGRKRKPGRRHPNGELNHPKDLNVAVIASFHPDRQGLPEAQRVDQRAGTPLGRLNLAGQIDDQQLEASRRYARTVRLYHEVIGCPSPNAPSLNPMMAGVRASRSGFEPSEIARRKEEYEEAWLAISDAGHKACRAVARTAIYEEWLPLGTTMSDLIRGLAALARHYGLTHSRKSVTSRNAG